MSAPFDAYHQWLGIPPIEQPPDHYRLLGISRFEDSDEVIANAADRQMAHVRTYQSGKHSALSQKVLNEISSARLCLLDPKSKAAYDQELRRSPDSDQAQEQWRADATDFPSQTNRPAANQDANVLPAVPMSRPESMPVAVPMASPPMPSPPMAAPPSNPPPLPGVPSHAATTQPIAGQTRTLAAIPVQDAAKPSPVPLHKGAQRSPVQPALIALGAVSLVLLLIMSFVFMSGSGDDAQPIESHDFELAQKPATIDEQANRKTSDDNPIDKEEDSGKSTNASQQDDSDSTDKDDDKSNDKSSDSDDEKQPATSSDDKTADDDPDDKSTTDPGSDDPPKTAGTTASDPSSDDGKAAITTAGTGTKSDSLDDDEDPFTLPGYRPPTTVTGATSTPADDSPKKQAPPVGEQFQLAEGKVANLYRDALASAKSYQDKRQLFDRLYQDAERYLDNPTTRYGILRKAYDTAINNGDFGQAQTALDKIIADYDVDSIRERMNLLKKAQVPFLRNRRGSQFAQEAIDLAREAIAARRFDEGEELANMAIGVARKLSSFTNRTLVAGALKARDDAKRKKNPWHAVQKLLPELEKDPNHPAANYVYGRFLCAYEGDFSQGLPMLAKGSNDDFKKAALLDLENPDTAQKQFAVGAAWYHLAHEERVSDYFYARAHVWLQKAVASLDDPDKAKANTWLTKIRAKNLSNEYYDRTELDYD